jgi:putative transposase
MPHQTFVFKLRPTKAQEAILSETLETCRWLYNYALGERKSAWEKEQRSVGFAEQSARLPRMKAALPFLGHVHSQVLQDVLHRVQRSLEGFFRRVRLGKVAGYPRFKGAGWYDSFTLPQWENGVQFVDGRLVVSKIGTLRVCADRPLHGTPKTCTIRRRADGWYACIVCEYEPCPWPETGQSVGIDLGLEAFATLDTGERIPNPRPLKRAQRKLKFAQRRLSRRTKGSQRRRKARVLLAKAHLRVQRARLDHAHQVAHDLISRFDTIYVEKLNIQGMLKNHPLAQAISDVAWGLFLAVLGHKAASAGRRVVEVDPRYTSQDCSHCGARVPKKLSDRWHTCPFCGFSCHRDENAARNTKKKGGDTAFGETMRLLVV